MAVVADVMVDKRLQAAFSDVPLLADAPLGMRLELAPLKLQHHTAVVSRTLTSMRDGNRRTR